MPDPTILAFDTSGPHCAAALLIGGKIVASRFEPMTRGQAERLFPMLDEVMGEVGAVWEELEAIGVGVGPGNFTGIRISVSAARGLALSLKKPAIGVTSFEALRGPARFADPAPSIVSLPASRKGKDVLIQYFKGGKPQGAPQELAIFGTDAENPEFQPLPGIAPVFGHECAAVDWALHGSNEAGCSGALVFGDSYPISHAIAQVAALKLACNNALPRPAPLYIRPPDAAPPSTPPLNILP